MRLNSFCLTFCFLAVCFVASTRAIDLENIPSPYPTSGAAINGVIPDPELNFEQIWFYGSVILDTVATSIAWDAPQQISTTIDEVLFPCQYHLYRLDASQFTDYVPGDYLHIEVEYQNDLSDNTGLHFPLTGEDYIQLYVSYDSTGSNPPLDPNQPDWSPLIDELVPYQDYSVVTTTGIQYGNSNQIFYEITPCDMTDEGFFWIAVYNARGTDQLEYNIYLERRRPAGTCDILITTECLIESVTPITLGNIVATSGDPLIIAAGATRKYINDTRAHDILQQFDITIDSASSTVMSDPQGANIPMHYRYFSVDFSAYERTGVYAVINISQVEGTFAWFYNWGSVPFSDGVTTCGLPGDDPGPYCSPVNVNFTWETTSLILEPCDIQFDQLLYIGVVMGRSYFPLDLGSGNFGEFGTGIRSTTFESEDFTSFEIDVAVYEPVVTSFSLGTPLRAVIPAVNLRAANINIPTSANLASGFFRLDLTDADFGPLSTLNFVIESNQESRVRFRFFDGTTAADQLTDFICYDCEPDYDEDTCTTLFEYVFCDSRLAAGTYFFLIEPSTPTDFTYVKLHAYITEKAIPSVLEAGVPAHNTLENGDYAYYVVNVPVLAEQNTWLYVELFALGYNAETSTSYDTTLEVSMKAGQIPEDVCSQVEADWKCTLDISEFSDMSTNACNFFVDACFLEAGPFYITVHSIDNSDIGGGDPPLTRSVDVPGLKTSATYTLWAEFESAVELQNNVTYSDIVLTNQYNHYYIKVDEVVQGSWFTVEVDNAQTGFSTGDSTYNVFLNYGSLAGACPCYDSLYNCTGNLITADYCAGEDSAACTPETDHNLDLIDFSYDEDNSPFDLAPEDDDSDLSCCKLYADGCDFRAGTWYISVLNSPNGSPNTKEEYVVDVIGYTITAIIHPPPPVFELAVETPVVDWIDPDSFNHYIVDTDYVYGADLAVKVTWMQDACFREIGYDEKVNGGFKAFWLTPNTIADISYAEESVQLRLSGGSLALPECYNLPWSCSVPGRDEQTGTYSSCTVVIPNCEWSKLSSNGPLFASVGYLKFNGGVFGNYAQVTIEVSIEKEYISDLTIGVPVTSWIAQNRYHHYSFPVDPALIPNSRLEIQAYFNHFTSQTYSYPFGNYEVGEPTLSLQFDRRAGGVRACPDCFDYYLSHSDTSSIHWSLDPCTVQAHGAVQYYLSVYNPTNSFFDQSLEYTLSVWTEDALTVLDFSELWPAPSVEFAPSEIEYNIKFNSGDDHYQLLSGRHYRFNFPIPAILDSDYVRLAVRAVTDVEIYLETNALAGPTCCYTSYCYQSLSGSGEQSCSEDVSAWEIILSATELRAGNDYYLFVRADESADDDPTHIFLRAEFYSLGTFDSNNHVITGTTSESIQFNLGHESEETLTTYNFDLNHVDAYIGEYNEGYNFDEWLTDGVNVNHWNTANLWRNETVLAGRYRFHPITITTGRVDQVFFGLDNVYQNYCDSSDDTDTILTLYYLGCGETVAELLPTPDQCPSISRRDVVLTNDWIYDYLTSELPEVGASTEEATSYSLVRLDSCSASCSGTHWIAAVASASVVDQLGDAGYLPTITYDLHIFLQSPIPLPEYNDIEADLNSTLPAILTGDYSGWRQRYILSDSTMTTGVLPMTEIVLEKNLNIFTDSISPFFFNLRIEIYKDETASYDDASGCCDPSPDDYERRAGLGSIDMTNANCFPSVVVGDDIITGCSEIASLTFFPDDICPQGAADCLITILPCQLDNSVWYIDITSPDPNINSDVSPYQIYYNVLSDRFPTGSLDYDVADIFERNIVPDPTVNPILLSGMDNFHFFKVDIAEYVAAGPYVDNAAFRGRLEIQVYYESFTSCTVNCGDAAAVTFISYSNGTGLNDAPPVVPGFSNWTDFAIYGDNDNWDGFIACESSYTCFTQGGDNECSSLSQIFVVPECELKPTDSFWITTRLMIPGDVGLRFQVRIVEPVCDPTSTGHSCTDISSPVDADSTVDSLTTSADPVEFFGTDGASDGIEPGTWVHHRFAIDSSVTEDQTVEIVLTNDYTTVATTSLPGDIYLRISRYAVAQNPDADSNAISTLTGRDSQGFPIDTYCADTSLPPIFACSIDGSTGGAPTDDRCYIQIPSTRFEAGAIYFASLYYDIHYHDHDTDDLTDPVNAVNPYEHYKGYNISIFVKDFNSDTFTVTGASNGFIPSQCTGDISSTPGVRELGNDVFDNGFFPSNYLNEGQSSFFGIYDYYSITVSPDDLDLICTNDVTDTCLFEHTLIVNVENTDPVSTHLVGPINVLFYAPQSLLFNNEEQPSFVPRYYEFNYFPQDFYDADPYTDGVTTNYIFSLADSVDANATIAYTACPSYNNVALRPGTYYIVVQTQIDNDYEICAYLDRTDYIPPGTGAFTSIADADVIFGDVTVLEILSDSHSAFVSPALPVDDYYYRFRIEDSDLTDGAYLQIWLDDIISCDSTRTTCVDPSSLSPSQYPSISVFRDDCESWSADLDNADIYGSNYGGTVTGFSEYGFLRRIVIGTSDVKGYDSCGLDSGTYFIHVNSPGDIYDWVLEVYIRYPQVFPPETVTPFLYQQYLADSEIHIPSIYASIWQYQYQVYHVVPTTPTRFVKNDPLYAYITNTGCGTLQAWAKLGSPAGPGVASYTRTDTAQYCYHASCDSITSGDDCTLETQPCYQWPDIAGEGQSIDIYYTIYGYEQTANDLNTYRGAELSPSSDFLENYYAPISYTFSVFYADYVIDDNLDFGCPQPLVFSDDSFTACLEDPVEPTLAQLTAWKTEHRFKWNVETRPLFSELFYTPISVVGPSWIDNCDVSNDYPERTIPSPQNGDSTDYSYSRNFITLVPEPYTEVNPSLQRSTIAEQGPVTVSPFIDGIQYETQAELSRLSYWVPTIYPGVVYSGSLGENGNELSAYYKFSNPADYEYFDFSSSVEGGTATFSVFSITECGSSGYSISDPIFDCFPFDDNLFLKVTFGVNGGCQSPCAAVEYTFSYVIRPEITSITCEDSYCFDDGTSEEAWWSFDSDVPAIFTSDNTLYGRIHTIESDADYWTYDSTFCSTAQCPEYTGLFLLDSGATYLKIECESVEIETLTFNELHEFSPTASSGTDYYRFVLPPGDYSLVYDFGFSATLVCGDISYYLRYEALPSDDSDCHTDFGTCNPAAGQYFVRVDYTFDINLLDSQHVYTIGWFYNTFVTVEVDPNEWSQHTLLAGEVRLFQFDTSTVANTPDSYLQFDYVVNSDGSVDEVDYSDFHGLQLGYVSAYFGLGSASSCYELDSTDDDVQPYGEDAFPYSRGIPVCNYEPGVYSIPITANVDVTFSVNPQIKTIGITPNDLGAVADGVITVSESLSFSHFVREWHYYTTTVTGGDADVLTRYGQARLANVVGGGLRLSAAGNFFISESYDFTDITYNQQNILANNINDQCQQAYSCLTFDTYEAQYATDIDEDYLLNNYAGSCAIVICPQTYATWTQAFFAVAIDQYVTDPTYLLQADPYQPVSYQLVISEHVPETLTSTPAHVDIAAFDFGTGYASQANRQAHFLPTNVESFFYEFSSEQSVKITVSVEGTHVYDGVLVKIFDASPCEDCYSYFWCGAQYDEFLCEFEVSTDAEKLSGQYYVEVFANSITSFDISATEGLDNCEFPEASGSLDFCTGLVDYPVWQWTSYTTLDAEASCLYDTLVADFEAADCDILCNPDPLSFDCYQALQRFACYESFRPCDINGFSTSTCRAACQTVESQCERTFAGASHDQYSCTASRYIDDEDYPDLHCAGPLLDLTPRDTPDELPDVLTRFKVFKNQLLENFEYPEADPNFGFNLN